MSNKEPVVDLMTALEESLKVAKQKKVQEFWENNDPKACPADQGGLGAPDYDEGYEFCAKCGAQWSEHS